MTNFTSCEDCGNKGMKDELGYICDSCIHHRSVSDCFTPKQKDPAKGGGGMTNSELIKHIREAVEAATDGPWRQGTPPPNGERTIGTMCGMLLAVATTGENANTENNAHLIANAPTWLTELCKRLEEADALLHEHVFTRDGY